uniref:Protein kinase C-like 3 n=2 Tax=Bactrocera dorsalis TaxID=27457 RepID=A0A034VNE1_BACDO
MDLADQIDDYICSFEGIGDLTMDSLAMFIFIWAVLALFLVWLCKFLYNKYMVNNNNKTPTSQSNSRQSSVAPGAASAAKTEASKRLSEPREVMASKADFKDLAAKPGGAARGRAPGGGAGGAAAGAGARRRMVRQGSTGPESRKKRYVPPPSNVVGPETTSVTWTSQVFRWLYSDLVIVNELLTSWVIALNETLKKSMEEHGVAVEVVRVLPDSPPPSLNNIFCNCDETNPSNMLITFDCDAQPVLQVKTYRQKAGKVDTSHYKVTISRFRARMATAMNYNTLKGEMKVDGYPDIRVAMNSVGAIKPMDQDEQQLQGVISDIITATLRDTVYPVDFSVYATCPRAEIDPLDMPQNLEGSNLSGLQPMISGRRLLVKIVKGEGLAEAKDPYVVVEMDEPAQKNQTGARQGATPYWDEHFLFELSPQSAEILFEVYDRPANGVETAKFLGLGLVGIDELAVGPASTQVLTLQPRPYETNPVSGTITVDFVFIEGAEIPAGPKPYKLKEALKISTPVINEHMKNGAGLADAAVRALQDGALSTTGQPSKSTLIIHSVQRNQNNSNAFKVEVNKDGRIEVKESPQEEVDGAVTQILESPLNDNTSESLLTANTTADIEQIQQEISVATDITASPTDSCPPNDVSLDESGVASGNSSALVASSAEFGQPNAASSPQAHNGYSPYNGNSATNSSQNYGYQSNSLPRNGAATSTPLSSAELDERGRSKKRNFFGTLKKRLSRSKTRTHSADRGALTPSHNNNGTTPTGTLNGDSRSLSVDRAVLSKSNSLGLRAGSSRLDHSRQSSISESSAISGFSSASNKTYVHEASTLVLETIENGVKRHFIVPLAIAQRPRWRRKGTKLHIYNDHTFIAKHLSGGGLQCQVCMKSIPRRPGKQGYECRDCNLICHKQCHIRAPQACPNPTVLSMELTSFPVLTEQDIL